jgi:parallel beta-helix repeat protein
MNNATWGFIVANAASRNTVESNLAIGNRLLGYALNGAVENVLQGNIARNNGGNGFGLCCSSQFNTLVANTSSKNGASGFAIDFSVANTFTRNVANLNDAFGFGAFDGAERNVFTANSACRNELLDALDVHPAAGNTWLENKFCTSGGV